MSAKLLQSYLTLCDLMYYSPPGSSVHSPLRIHGILQARILEWVAMPSSRGSSLPRDRTQVSCIADRFFTSWATREGPHQHIDTLSSETGFVEILKRSKDKALGHFQIKRLNWWEMPPVFGRSPGAQGLLEAKERVMSFNRCSWEIQEHEDWEVGPPLKDFCFTWLFNALHFLLFHGSLSEKGWLCPWWGHFCLSGAGGPSLTESWREDLLYWKGKWKIPAHF